MSALQKLCLMWMFLDGVWEHSTNADWSICCQDAVGRGYAGPAIPILLCMSALVSMPAGHLASTVYCRYEQISYPYILGTTLIILTTPWSISVRPGRGWVMSDHVRLWQPWDGVPVGLRDDRNGAEKWLTYGIGEAVAKLLGAPDVIW